MKSKKMTVAIKVENLSKKYLINHEIKSERYETFSETLIQGSKSIAKKIIHPFSGKDTTSQTQEEFWTLKEINFGINQSDKLYTIMRNCERQIEISKYYLDFTPLNQ